MPLTKTFTPAGKSPYPHAVSFKSHEHIIKNLAHFHQLIVEHAKKGHCLLKGLLDRPLDWESRAGHTNPHTSTDWLCYDLDNIKSVNDVETFMHRIGLANVSYILQYSSSYGINGNFSIRAHIFVLLKEKTLPAALKTYLRQLNSQYFLQDMELTKTNVALRWPLDITTCQNDKLLYIAPPICKPETLNHFGGDRIQLIKKKIDFFDFSTVILQPAEHIRAIEEAEINRLRKAANLPEKKSAQFKQRELKGESYLPNPDQATVSGIKEERGFVYLNLNGGDSWGYYHPVDNPAFVFNFKGEPTYKTSELLPDYWSSLQAMKKQQVKTEAGNRLFLAFRDLRTAEYFNGWYDEEADELTLHIAKSEKQLIDFLANYGQPTPENIPIWSIIYDPDKPIFDPAAKTVNTFRASTYMRTARNQQNITKVNPNSFPTITKLVQHVVGDEMHEHFINWLAYIFQFRRAPCTAWIFQGTQGTGKGLLINNVIAPLLGSDNVAIKRMEELEEKFNSFLEGSLFVYVDEAQVSDSSRSRMIMANLKNYITEPTITVRRMRQTAYDIINYCAWCLGGNMNDTVMVDDGDRRFNIGLFQTEKLVISDEEIDDIVKELQNFAHYLQSYKVDKTAVRTPKRNEAKEDIISVSRSSADTIASALLRGDLSILWDSLPTVAESMLDTATAFRLQPYKALVIDLVTTRRNKLTREELFIIFNYNIGNVPSSPWKLTTYLKHHGLKIKDIRVGEKTMKGIILDWTNSDIWFAQRKREIEDMTTHSSTSSKRRLDKTNTD